MHCEGDGFSRAATLLELAWGFEPLRQALPFFTIAQKFANFRIAGNTPQLSSPEDNARVVYSQVMKPIGNLEKVQQYLRCIEQGEFAYIADLFSPNATVEQLPNRLYPNGLQSGVSRMAEAFEKGKKLLSSQNYEITSFIADGDRLSIQVRWTGTLAMAFGSLTIGSQMRADCAMFFVFEDGKIVSQRNYDCFHPW